jgi:hypothetical protein
MFEGPFFLHECAPLCYCRGTEAGGLADQLTKMIDPKPSLDGQARPPPIDGEAEAELTTPGDLRMVTILLENIGGLIKATAG